MGEQTKKAKLFALSTCSTCKRVREFLEGHSVPHEVIEVDKLDSGEQWLMSKELRKYNPKATYPTLVIEETIMGYDEEAMIRSLGLR
jgi:glutaredoxin